MFICSVHAKNQQITTTTNTTVKQERTNLKKTNYKTTCSPILKNNYLFLRHFKHRYIIIIIFKFPNVPSYVYVFSCTIKISFIYVPVYKKMLIIKWVQEIICKAVCRVLYRETRCLPIRWCWFQFYVSSRWVRQIWGKT